MICVDFRIFPSVVTTNDRWRQRISEAGRLGIDELAFFPTCLSESEREEAYHLLIEAGISSIPLVHLRSDMRPAELELLINQFGTKKFNIHSPLDIRYRLEHNLTAFKNIIYVENSSYEWKDSVSSWAGICLDVTHMESENIVDGEVLSDWNRGLKKYSVGVWHVSAIHRHGIYSESLGRRQHDVHSFDNLSRFDYVKKYRKFLTDIVALELENTIKEQLEAKDYIEKILS